MPKIEITTPPQSRTEISDLIGNAPSWLLRSGIGMIAITVVSLLSMCAYITYPDKITGQGYLTALTPPVTLITKANGYLDTLMVVEGQEVSKGDIICHINASTTTAEIAQLTTWIDSYQAADSAGITYKEGVPGGLQLGDLQGDYAALQLKHAEMIQHLRNELTSKKINSLSQEIAKIKALNASQRKEKDIYTKELALEQKDYERNKAMNTDKVISNLDMEKSQTALLQKQRQHQSMENTSIQNNIRIEQLAFEQIQLRGDYDTQLRAHQRMMQELIARIRTRSQDWARTYTVEAPVSGRITFHTPLSTLTYLKAEQELGYLLPLTPSPRYINTKIPMANAGKLAVGQQAIIKLDAYPYKEHGMVQAKVSAISTLPATDDKGVATYQVTINLPDSITTDTKTYIPYKPNMTAQIQIITEDLTILQRIFYRWYELVK